MNSPIAIAMNDTDVRVVVKEMGKAKTKQKVENGVVKN
ncbi:MAG: hypothetical protein JWN45_2730 [Acidobacteriaceae bacterium]|nr:hypothetical protein [Acidobacteriaceae bacterium]